MMKVAERVLVSSQSTRRDFLSAVRLQKNFIIFPEVTNCPKPLTERPWEQQNHWEHCNSQRLPLWSFIHSNPMNYLVSNSPLEHLMGVDAACLFTDGHFLRHKVTVFHVQHSTSCKHNEICRDGWGQMAHSLLVVYPRHIMYAIFGYFLEIII